MKSGEKLSCNRCVIGISIRVGYLAVVHMVMYGNI